METHRAGMFLIIYLSVGVVNRKAKIRAPKNARQLLYIIVTFFILSFLL